MTSNRRVRRMIVILCVVATLILVACLKDTITDALSSPFSSIASSPSVKIVTVVVEQPQTLLRESGPTADHTGTKGGKATGEHLFLANGLMEVNVDGRHPIFDLMDRGEAQWNAKLKRQSKTLREAVREYKRRHKRAPPKGFDHWWYWCEKHNVHLPDEYDQIYRDLEPFWGMDPVDMRRLQSEHENDFDSYTIGKGRASDPISVLKMRLSYHGEGTHEAVHIEQAQDLIDLLEDVQDFIRPFRATFSPHDNPNLFLDWEVKTNMLRAAATGEYVDLTNPPEVKLDGWIAACDPSSPVRQSPIDFNTPPPPAHKKTFIYDHVKSMDPCEHPTLLHHSGQFLSNRPGPVPDRFLVPQFSQCSTQLHGDIIPAAPIAWVDDTNPDDDVPWGEKVEERLLWRGTDTGMWHAPDTPWRGSQRVRLVRLANERNGTVRILAPRKTRDERVGDGEEWRATRVNPAMMDAVFAVKPTGCEDEVCDIMNAELRFTGEYMGPAEAGKYKYVFDTDGNGWSSRFKRLMVSRSLIFKSTIYPEWFAGRVQEYVHYVPVQMDFSDLHDALTFFRGGLNDENGHDDLAEKIASAGREWARTYWRREDLTAYMFRLMLEYARLFSLDREAASYGDADMDNDWD